MGKWWKVAGGTLAGLAVIAAAGVYAGLQLAERKQARRVQVKVQAVAVAAGAAALERGRYLFTSRGCVDCHGSNGGGRVFVEKGDDLRIKGPNITRGTGGVVAAYQGEDWIRTIRHGVAPGGRPLMVMPSEDYNRFTDADLGALVAYVQALPPATGTGAEVRLPLPARVLYGFGGIEDAAARIDHTLPPAQPVAEGVTLQHGAYVANMCLGCHGAQLAGGKIPGGPPDWPAAADLTAKADVMKVRYADPEAFIRMFKSGKRVDGTAIQVMPFESLRNMSDTDLRALHLYLKSRPA
jgi:mono/diheme cytochrome c family protein